MPILVTCKFDEDPTKTEDIIDRIWSNMGFFWYSSAGNSKVDSLFWSYFELIRDFMHLLVISKSDKDPIKNEGTMPGTFAYGNIFLCLRASNY